MQIQRKPERKVLAAVASGVVVWLAASLADLALLPLNPSLLPHQLIANVIAGLVAVVVTLAVKLRHEEVHLRVAMERAAIVADVNHNVRNAVFPLCLAVQRLGDPDVTRIADDAMERINVALRDATTDALAYRVDYALSEKSSDS